MFLLFLDGTFWGNLARQTNLYAAQHKTVHEARKERRNHHKPWSNVDVGTMQQFIGVFIAMGLNSKAKIEYFWSTDILYHMPFFGRIMSVDRFLDILRFLHIVDNKSCSDSFKKNDPLWKIRPFLDGISSKFKTLFYPGKQLILDEGTCPYKGRVRFLSYNPQKPSKYGIKIYEVCDAVTGYCCVFKIASGESIQTTELVLDLMRDYLGKGHEVYMDRFYTSIRLFQELYSQRTVAVGTCMPNRKGLPKIFSGQKLTKGTVISCRQGPVLAIKWCDKREVLMLSTKHIPTMTSVSVKAPGGHHKKLKPTVVQDYNAYMQGVDNSDQMLKYYSFNRKTMKWWKKLFMHLLGLVIVNASKLYNFVAEERDCPKIELLTFTELLAKDLVQIGNARIPFGNMIVRDEFVGRTRGVPPRFCHFPERTRDEHNVIKQRACVVCSKRNSVGADSGIPPKRPRRSGFRCRLCKVTLCLVECFEDFHTKEKYWE